MIKEIPILFSTAMVQAILAGRKNQTRRLMEPQPWYGSQVPGGPHFIFPPGSGQRFNAEVSKNGDWYVMQEGFQGYFSKMAKWQPGDLLWVRENWQLKGWDFEEGTMRIGFATGETINCKAYDPTENSEWLMNQVERLENDGNIIATSSEKFEFTSKKQPFKPSIHMPKAAARIWLQVTSVRVERLQDISEENAKAEGAECVWLDEKGNAWYEASDLLRNHDQKRTFKQGFKYLWNLINGPEFYQANPWVWVMSFKVLSTTGKPDVEKPESGEGIEPSSPEFQSGT